MEVVLKKLDLLGKVYTNNRGEDCEVIAYLNNKSVTVRFKNSGYVGVFPKGNLDKGRFLDPMSPTVYGVGFLGKEQRDFVLGERHEMAMDAWRHILRRCYCPKFQANHPAYVGCSVDKRWHNFSAFEEWVLPQRQFDLIDDNKVSSRWNIDKDILLKDNKVYSPETCCLVPQEVNSLLSAPNTKGKLSELPIGVHNAYTQKMGIIKYSSKVSLGNRNSKHLGTYDTVEEAFLAYKKAKEAYIKEVAEKWKGKIDDKVYEALLEWKIEITD